MIHRDRLTARLDGEFAVFLIGMRINHPWKVHKWLPVAAAMPKMLAELAKNPDLGYLGGDSWFGRTTLMVSYWRSKPVANSSTRAMRQASPARNPGALLLSPSA